MGGSRRQNASVRTWTRRNAVTGEMISDKLKPLPRAISPQPTQRAGYKGERASMAKALNLPRINSHDRTLAWTHAVSEVSHDTGIEAAGNRGNDGSEVYDRSNISVYANGIPDTVKRLPFSTIMLTHPRLFGLVVKQMKNDEDYFQWTSSPQDWARLGPQFENELVIPTFEPNPPNEDDIDHQNPALYGERLISVNGVTFKNPWVVGGNKSSVASSCAVTSCESFPQFS